MPNIIMADKSTGEWTTVGILQGQEPNGEITVDGINLASYALSGSAVTKFHGTNIVLASGVKPFQGSKIEECFLQSNSNQQINGLFSSSSKLKKAVLIVKNNNQSNYALCSSCGNLEVLDITGTVNFQVNTFSGCNNFKTLIIRDNRMGLQSATVFNTTPFANGGTGGTIYIPKSLYDHLGDGTSSDYKAVAGWATLDGYGTVTWAKIEGSIYETQYADGTPIPSA